MALGKDLLLVFLQLAPAVIISAGINFAVAYAMYHDQHRIFFFPFPNTIAGDLAVTNFVQGVLNYLVPCATLELDNRLGNRLPWRSIMNPPRRLVKRIANLTGRKKQFWRVFLQSEDILLPPLGFKVVAKRLALAALRGLFLSVFLFLITWSLSVAILCPIYCGKNIGGIWAPQAIKGVYGGVHTFIEIVIASFLVVLSIDVRNHEESVDWKQSSGDAGAIPDSERERLIPVGIRTNYRSIEAGPQQRSV